MEEIVRENKDFRTLDEIKSEKNYQNLVEEIADVQIMLWQMEYLLKAEMKLVVEDKINRQIERIEGR